MDLENYGYPQYKKTVVMVFMPMLTFMSHMAGMEEYYPYFKENYWSM
jgi:hypothetical protein